MRAYRGPHGPRGSGIPGPVPHTAPLAPPVSRRPSQVRLVLGPPDVANQGVLLEGPLREAVMVLLRNAERVGPSGRPWLEDLLLVLYRYEGDGPDAPA